MRSHIFYINSKLLRFLILIFIFSFFIFHLSRQAQAQTTLPLIVTPTRQELTVEPGNTGAATVKFLNQGQTPVSGILRAADFIVEDKEGTPTFLEGEKSLPLSFAASSWVELPYDRITIAAKDKVTIQAKIAVPEGTKPGGRYLAIYFEPGGTAGQTAGEKQASTPISIRIASLVYLRVAGPVEEKAFLLKFACPKFLEYGPIKVTSEILNRGNLHIRPRGTITLTNFLGKEVGRQVLKEENIFPDTSRIFVNSLGPKWMLGKYKLNLTASYGETGQVLTATTFAWVFPWKVGLSLLLAIIAIILTFVLFYNRVLKREKQLEKKVEELEEKLKEP
jgi:preprotein translocase subunit YajC